MGLLSRNQLEALGFKSLGENIKISDKASIYGASNITLGDNIRIDDFCVISSGAGGIFIGNHIHIAIYSSIIGQGKVTLSDFSNISSRVSIYSSNDDYSGSALTSPVVSPRFTNVMNGEVYLGKHVIVGSGSIILPNSIINEGVAIGALSMVKGELEPFTIYAGNPLRKIRERKRILLSLEKEFLEEYKQQ
ncbi:acyltransferase [Escherichia albertii]|uniref:acyltransferase n=1 Tax=Escherichia albertii TaxID=208962 RepID=UPI00235ECAC8|nr:acyltransferase [Escherichia albertii]WDB75966.1 acyltransferase [Escherichia albertii]